jgi:hypothetical protein
MKLNNDFKQCIVEFKQLRDVMDIQIQNKPFEEKKKFKKRYYNKY